MKGINQYKEDFILLLEAGFIAVNQADDDSATKLFKAAQVLDPKNALALVGFGYLHLHKLELKQSIQAFEDAIKMDADCEMAKAFMGLAISLQANGSTKGDKILHETAHSKDPMVKRMSETAIDFVERFVKKTPGPAGGSKPHH